jgi:hypothetical protein
MIEQHDVDYNIESTEGLRFHLQRQTPAGHNRRNLDKLLLPYRESGARTRYNVLRRLHTDLHDRR